MSSKSGSVGRLERMLALVPWILAHPGTTISELARRFEVDEEALEHDLELLPLCGLPPYTADRLIDVWVADDGAVNVRLAEYFERPVRLTPAEGVALVAAVRALLAVPGSDQSGPLASALEKLENALGARGGMAIDVRGGEHLQRLQEAVAAHEQLEIEYYSYARDEVTTRVVDPIRVFHAFGEWYLQAYCHRATEERMFRVDRVRNVQATGETVSTERGSSEELTDAVYRPTAEDLRVKLRLDPSASWVAETVPTESAKSVNGGGTEVVLAVSAPAFLERLLLTLGPAAQVLDPPEAKALVASAAERVLRRYERAA